MTQTPDRLGEITPSYTMRFERECKHPAARLWRALTDAGELAKWMGMPSARVDLRVGGEYYVEFPEGSGQLDGVIVRLEAERTLAYVWGVTVVEWKITPEGDRCRFSFVHYGQPPGMVEHEGGIAAGWHAWLDDVELYLDTGSVTNGSAAWKELTPIYGKRIGEVVGP